MADIPIEPSDYWKLRAKDFAVNAAIGAQAQAALSVEQARRDQQRTMLEMSKKYGIAEGAEYRFDDNACTLRDPSSGIVPFPFAPKQEAKEA